MNQCTVFSLSARKLLAQCVPLRLSFTQKIPKVIHSNGEKLFNFKIRKIIAPVRSKLKWPVIWHSRNISKECMRQYILWTSCFGTLTTAVIWHIKRYHTVLCEYKPVKHDPTRFDSLEEAHPPFPWKLFFTFLWPDFWYLIGAILSALAVAVVNIQIPLVLGSVVNVLSTYTDSTEGNFMQDIKKPSIKLIQMYIVQSLMTFVYISLLTYVGENTALRMRRELFHSIINQDIEFFDAQRTGEIVNRITADVQEFKSSVKLFVSQGLRSLTQSVGCVVSLCVLSFKLTGLMVVVVPAIIGVGTLLGTGLRRLSRKSQAQVSKATGVADEAIGNARTVKAFAMEDHQLEMYKVELEESAHLNLWLGLGIGVFQALSNLALNGIVLGTMYAGGSMMVTKEIQAGDLMAFMVATQTIQRSLAQLSVLFGQVVRGISSGARVFEYIQLKPTMIQCGNKIIPYHSLHGDVSFKNVSFGYPTRPGQVVLKDFSIDIKGGHMVALVGLSGGGKSTVASLLERFYDVTDGEITIDNESICNLDPHWLRGKAIGFISQEPVLFATSVIENIRFGKPDATDEQVYEAARQANAHNFIESFPSGYDTVLGERGVTVSGGQKQRIAIARALIKNPRILVLDEATSALDAESEKVVQETLDKVIQGRTVLVIAHRLSTVKNANIIAVMREGKIVEQGTHEELKKRRGIYWDLIKLQQDSESQSVTQTLKGMLGRGT